MKISLIALCANLLAVPGSSQLTTDIVSCQNHNGTLKNVTQSVCSIDTMFSKKCNEKLKALPQKTLIQLARQAEQCKNDLQERMDDIEELEKSLKDVEIVVIAVVPGQKKNKQKKAAKEQDESVTMKFSGQGQRRDM